MTKIYILKLENGKYYVGKTNNLRERIRHHISGSVCEWTKIHPVVYDKKDLEDVEQIPVDTIYDDGFMELSYTLNYMKTHGVDNVRGADYSNINLSIDQKEEIERHFRNENGVCLRCGSDEHYLRDCENEEENEEEENDD